MNVWCIIQAQVFFYPFTNCVYVDENPKVTEVPTEGMGSQFLHVEKVSKKKNRFAWTICQKYSNNRWLKLGLLNPKIVICSNTVAERISCSQAQQYRSSGSEYIIMYFQ
jgi:1,4-dihydroxy-2-naphthoyl-CoA synthase